LHGDPVESVFRGDGWVSVYGLGYVGLSLAAVYLRKGLRVIGVDINEPRLEAIRDLRLGGAEPEVAEAIRRGLAEDRMRLTPDGSHASRNSVVKVVTVPVYLDWLSRRPGFEAIISASKSIASGLKRGDLVIIESSVPPGTTE
jgi:UDP-N-acetyl-D-mannosaminuronate dehydrogenase